VDQQFSPMWVYFGKWMHLLGAPFDGLYFKKEKGKAEIAWLACHPLVLCFKTFLQKRKKKENI